MHASWIQGIDKNLSMRRVGNDRITPILLIHENKYLNIVSL